MIVRASYGTGQDVFVGLDVASTESFKDGVYTLEDEAQPRKTPEQMIEFLASWARRYPIRSIEDGRAEDDRTGWKLLTEAVGKSVQFVGDDLFVTNSMRLRQGIDGGIASNILIEGNQIGSPTETFAVVELARRHHYTAVIGHRPGDTEDATIADVAIVTYAGRIETGTAPRSDRITRYNRLQRIEEFGASAVHSLK